MADGGWRMVNKLGDKLTVLFPRPPSLGAHGASLIFLRTEVCYTKPASSPLDGNKHEAEAEAEAEAESGSGSGGGGGTETDSDSEVPEQRKQDNDEDKDSKRSLILALVLSSSGIAGLVGAANGKHHLISPTHTPLNSLPPLPAGICSSDSGISTLSAISPPLSTTTATSGGGGGSSSAANIAGSEHAGQRHGDGERRSPCPRWPLALPLAPLYASPLQLPLTSSQSITKLSYWDDYLQQISYLPTTRIYSTPTSIVDEDKAQQDFLSLSLSPPLNRRRDMPALRGPSSACKKANLAACPRNQPDDDDDYDDDDTHTRGGIFPSVVQSMTGNDHDDDNDNDNDNDIELMKYIG
ncbi:GL20795 [Drosophila persimilis]|uniref:GL20795 n=1 Tax=Drosophila persimilis TaxID=7234 RepID=B4H428_DROPE|nr:GL20795 [Drosophila persimilis]